MVPHPENLFTQTILAGSPTTDDDQTFQVIKTGASSTVVGEPLVQVVFLIALAERFLLQAFKWS